VPVFPFLAAVLALVPDQRAAPPHLNAAATPTPPLIDGRLDDAVWATAPGADDFTQSFPFDGGKPSERTSVRVLYDETAIYIGFDCEQIHTPIVERLTRRDRDSESEWVYVQIDSRNDGKSAYEFAVNIAGVLADAQIIDQTTYSWEWDENWEAKAARTATGWSAEIRIPLRVLRFDSKLPVQSWGLQATRFIAQREETDLWSYIPRDVAGPIAFFGRLDGLRNLRGAGALELQPFVLGYGRRRDASQTTTASGYDGSGSAGLDLKWHILQDLTFDAALNPDFAQVELDQVILNLSTYETFLPEKRPFFLEGIDAFSFPMQVFYSRRIGSAPVAPSLRTDASGQPSEVLVDVPSQATIYGAGKLVGRLSPDWTIGAMSAITGANHVTVLDNTTTPPSSESRLAAPMTAFNVLRLKYELGSGGHLGLIGTGSSTFESNGGYPPVTLANGTVGQLCPSGATQTTGGPCFHDGYVAGSDLLLRSPSGAYVLNGAFIESYIRGGPTVTQPDGTPIGPGASAPGGWLRVAKEGGKHLLWSAEYTGAGRALDYNDLGYMQRQNVQTLSASVGWRTLDPGKYTVDTTSAFVASDSRNLSWLDLGQNYELNTRLHLHDFSTVALAADYAPSRFDDREVGDGTALERAGYLGGRLEYDSDPRRSIYATIANQTQVMGSGIYATSVQASSLLHALPQLDIELLPTLTWAAGEYRYAWQSATAANAYFGKLNAKNVSVTLRASYTFTPRLTLQAYAQAFLASGHFSDLRNLMPDPGAKVRLSQLAASMPVPTGTPLLPDPDFEEAALNVNVVFRWEYRLGSTLYLVYTRSQIPEVANLLGNATLAPRAFDHGAATDVILLKLSYWWAS
jgi:outer membrane scaffolding protein for murein synthesis (MipA/OmpV family)